MKSQCAPNLCGQGPSSLEPQWHIVTPGQKRVVIGTECQVTHASSKNLRRITPSTISWGVSMLQAGQMQQLWSTLTFCCQVSDTSHHPSSQRVIRIAALVFGPVTLSQAQRFRKCERTVAAMAAMVGEGSECGTSDTLLTCCSTFKCCSLVPLNWIKWCHHQWYKIVQNTTKWCKTLQKGCLDTTNSTQQIWSDMNCLPTSSPLVLTSFTCHFV